VANVETTTTSPSATNDDRCKFLARALGWVLRSTLGVLNTYRNKGLFAYFFTLFHHLANDKSATFSSKRYVYRPFVS